MSQFFEDFFKRIQYHGEKNVKFDDVAHIMFQFARNVPFENIDIINGRDMEINANNVKRKIVDQNRGGLCYELNPMFYYFLKEVGFNVQLVAATVIGSDSALYGTHLAIVLFYDKEKYLIDVGFGSHLSLQPIPFTGEFVNSVTGEYRVKNKKKKMGEYVFEKYNDKELKTSYVFSIKPVDQLYLNYVKEIVTAEPQSPFNKSPLLIKLTDTGHITLTDKTYTVVRKGSKNKEKIDLKKMKQLGVSQFGIDLEYIEDC